MYDVMTRLSIHNMAQGGSAQADIARATGASLRSVQRILTEPTPTRAEVMASELPAGARRGRPPKADAAIIDQIRALFADERNAHLSAMEVLRRAKSWGYEGGRSQMAVLVKSLRPEPRKEPVVRFEGVAGEYAQFDFGEVRLELADGRELRVQFFAGRLKYSRLMHVEIVADQGSETVVRSLIACLAIFGGSPKEWVFDNAKSMRVSPIGVQPVVLHRYLRQLVAEYNVIATFCAPRSGNQKGTVERLVGFVKNSFFRQRTFKDLADVQAQLAEWLHEVNHVRPCDATGEIPAVRVEKERPWLSERPVQTTPDTWAIEITATVTPMGTVQVLGTSYSATDTKLGAPATVLIRKDRLVLDVRGERCEHVRADHTGEVRRLPEHRASMLAALHGRRKLSTFRRQCLLELGEAAEAFLEQLVHREPSGRWEGPCEELFGLLRDHGDERMIGAFARCVADRRYTAADVRAALREAA